MAVLIVAEHSNAALAPASLSTITAARELGGEVTVLVAGHGCRAAAEGAAAIDGVARVLIADFDIYENPSAENLAALVEPMAGGYGHILFPATTFGKNAAPRLAAVLDSQQISDIQAIVDADTFVRPIYAGNVLATVRSKDAIKVITIRATGFEKAQTGGDPAPIEEVDSAGDDGLSSFIGAQLSASERPELTSARVVISGGRGMGNSENFGLLEEIADRLGAAIGASRAAVDAGFVPNDFQVGQTGKIVAPELYIAVGISGAIQHLAGMKDSKVIVAINKDEDAPIFQVADYGIVGDLFEVLPQFKAALDAAKSG